MLAPIKIEYAYPSSDIGGRHGCYYFDADGERHGFVELNHAIATATTTGRRVELNFGGPSRADPYRSCGIVHFADNLASCT